MEPPPTDRELVAEQVRREAERGERLVALARALMYTVTSVAGASLAVLSEADGATEPLRRTLGWMTPPVIAAVWGWYWFVHSRPYRRLYGVVSVTGDVLALAAGVVIASLWLGDSIAAVNALGATPPLLGLTFVLAAAALRHDPALCLWAGALGLATHLVAAAISLHEADLSTLDAGIALFASPQAWLGRGLIIAFTTLLVALAARNARRLAGDTGAAMAERARVIQVFGRYVDSSVARAALAGDRGAETREVTVLFTDLREFTACAERLAPSETLSLLNDHYDALVPVVHRHGGLVNKFIGDAVMATFGAPSPTADHARRAVDAAREMVAAQDRLNQRLRAEGRPELVMGVGIATGPAVIGSLGAADRVEYAVIGDTVNTAARLEGLNKQLGTRILFSEATRRALGDDAGVRAQGEHWLKGKAQPVAVFTVEPASCE